MNVNGEAIYATRPWSVYGEGPTKVKEGSFTDTKREDFTAQDIRFTCKDEALYAIVLNRPAGKLVIKTLKSGSPSFPGQIQRVSLLGVEGSLSWKQDRAGLHISLPDELPGKTAYTFKIEVRK